ncbi:MAG: hypothetical protein ACT4TC_02545 [Myxococcaceae bacterium]
MKRWAHWVGLFLVGASAGSVRAEPPVAGAKQLKLNDTSGAIAELTTTLPDGRREMLIVGQVEAAQPAIANAYPRDKASCMGLKVKVEDYQALLQAVRRAKWAKWSSKDVSCEKRERVKLAVTAFAGEGFEPIGRQEANWCAPAKALAADLRALRSAAEKAGKAAMDECRARKD